MRPSKTSFDVLFVPGRPVRNSPNRAEISSPAFRIVHSTRHEPRTASFSPLPDLPRGTVKLSTVWVCRWVPQVPVKLHCGPCALQEAHFFSLKPPTAHFEEK